MLYFCIVKRWERWQDEGKHPKPQKKVSHLIKGKSGKAVKRQTEKVNTTFFEKSAFVVIVEIDCTLFQGEAFEVQKPFSMNKEARNGKG